MPSIDELCDGGRGEVAVTIAEDLSSLPRCQMLPERH